MKKLASVAGQDLRKKPFGRTTFPTKDSTSYARNLLETSSAEMGPMPSLKQLGKPGLTVKQMTPSFGTTKGDIPMPKQAGDSVFLNDPLVQYIQKHAETLLEQLGADAPGMNPPEPTGEPDFRSMISSARQHEEDVLKTLFDNAAAAKRHSSKLEG